MPYGDLCDFCKCSELCTMFCDGDCLMFGYMKNRNLKENILWDMVMNSVILSLQVGFNLEEFLIAKNLVG